MAGLNLRTALFGAWAPIVKQFHGSTMPTPQIPSAFQSLLSALPQPAANDPALAQRRQVTAAKDAAYFATAPRQNVLTGPSGVTSPAPVQRSTLLGQ